ncbi:MAG: hypothetical protein SOX83_03315 [Sodaliphilus sp.]|nr:hypothetical protein [Sodaliphilus sp.]
MEENKKSGVGDVRAKALSWDIEWEKAKNVFFGFFPLAPTVAQCAPLTSLAARKKKSLREKKVGFAEKKHACRKKNYSIVWKACPCLPHTIRHAVTLNPP